MALVGDLREVLEQLLPRIAGRDGSAWLKTIEASKGEVAVRDIKNLPDSGHLYAAHVMHDLWRITGGNAIVVTDVGQHQMWEAQYFHHEHPRTLITSGGLGTMGFALPAAIGAKVRLPRQRSLGHRRRRRLPDDRGRALHHRPGKNQDQHRHHQQRLPRHGPPVAGVLLRKNYEATPLVSPDFVKLADAHGIPGPRRPHPRRSCRPPLTEAAPARGAFLLNFLVEKEDSVYPMIPAGTALHEMIRRPGKDPLDETPQTISRRLSVLDQLNGRLKHVDVS